ncbi:hypothetical protein FQA47_001500 [Oryzias melastigma]|uniref:Uncharacterized protein n=1 Tax=Oryzias melastigma TaxID=30732 RepID=A0A834FS51_ORYME|nr:hypothetical protein FQA47_001500 [Oryzias melastigma]
MAEEDLLQHQNARQTAVEVQEPDLIPGSGIWYQLLCIYELHNSFFCKVLSLTELGHFQEEPLDPLFHLCQLKDSRLHFLNILQRNTPLELNNFLNAFLEQL